MVWAECVITCFLNLKDFFSQGVLGNFGPEGSLCFCYCVLHPVEMLTRITTRGTGWSCWPGVGFNAGSHEKHLDDGEDGLLQQEAVKEVKFGCFNISRLVCWSFPVV